ncbi:hypothetical protein [Nocardia sp. NPDC057227]|uniref:hypothetical protein n=1 Tax=Nocardia sp. NPDC057227 TaxID=3346056 RepID=UPI0036422C84
MTPTDVLDTKGALEQHITFIRAKMSEIDDLPAKVDTYAGHIVKAIRTQANVGFLALNVVSVGLVGFAAEELVDKVWEERDKVNAAVRATSATLKKIDPDLEVPINLIMVANEWRNFKGYIQAAEADFDYTALGAEWQGKAATRYVGMRAHQAKAFANLPSVCEEIAVSLENVARAEMALYGELATKSQELVEKITGIVTDFTKAVFNFPWGPVSSLADLATAAAAINTFVTDVVKSMGDSAVDNMIEGNRIAQNTSIQVGLPNNQWPPAVQKEVYAPAGSSALDDLRGAIADGTTLDGDKSDWEIGSTTVAAP